ncbi:MAG TPA: hypothetical protein VLY20_02410 [Nitrospiria bacterium]|nr:hypothetical protein [Nitrospiria bacterium]
MAIDGVTRENLVQRCLEPLRPSKPWQPDILLVRADAGPIVVKDYQPRGFLYRFFVGLVSTWNEARMYRKLAGLQGIPRYYGKLDRYALAIEYIEGRNASKFKTGELSHDFFHRLKQIVDSVHERNVVLCDLRNKKNIMISKSGEPYLIDLATAFERGRRWSFFRNGLYGIFYQDDYLGLAKLKRQLAPEILTTEEADRLDRGLFMQNKAVAVRNFCVRWLKRLVSPS